MLQPRISTRPLLIALFALALLGTLGVGPASGFERADAQAAPQQVLTGAAEVAGNAKMIEPAGSLPGWDGSGGSLQGSAASGCRPGLDFSALVAPLTPARALPAGQAPSWGGGRFHGFCPCGCSGIPDCNTSADCYAHAKCLTAPTCC